MTDSLGVNGCEWVGVGLGGLTLSHVLRLRAEGGEATRASAKSVIVLFNSGGVPHHESSECETGRTRRHSRRVRCHIDSYARFGDWRVAAENGDDDRQDRRRSLDGHRRQRPFDERLSDAHGHAARATVSRENAKPGKPNDWPAYNSLVTALRQSRGGLPASISLPRRLANNNGQDPWPGTDAGLLGRRFDPWFLDCDPNDPQFTVPGGELPGRGCLHRGSTTVRRMLEQFNRHAETARRTGCRRRLRPLQAAGDQSRRGRAGSGRRSTCRGSRRNCEIATANTGMARACCWCGRLVEAGVSLVQVQWVWLNKNKPNGGGWDTHEKHSESIKGWLLPVMDQVYTTLLDSLSDRGLLDETLVCSVAEFGHTPKFNAKAGRNHWGRAASPLPWPVAAFAAAWCWARRINTPPIRLPSLFGPAITWRRYSTVLASRRIRWSTTSKAARCQSAVGRC